MQAVRAPERRVHARLLAAIAVGGALGGMARYGVSRLIPESAAGFPWGTFSINVTGSFLLALLVMVTFDAWPPGRFVRAFFGVGFLGAFTTFSTFALEVDRRLAAAHTGVAVGYAAASLVAGLLATSAGLAVGRARQQPRQPHAADPRDPEDLGEPA